MSDSNRLKTLTKIEYPSQMDTEIGVFVHLSREKHFFLDYY